MKFKGTLISEASGSLAGITFSHNRGGQYVRSRAIPVNPNTTYQQTIRSLVSQLTNLWNSTLTSTQRSAWDAYAAAVPLLDALGEPRNATGLNHYVRSNVPRLQAGLTRVDAGPTTLNLGDYTEPTYDTLSAGGGNVNANFTTGDDWVSEDGAAMLLYGSRGKNPTINFFKGPYRYMGKIEGDSGTPPSSPAVITWPFAVTQGQRYFFRAQVSRADGRLSADARTFLAAAA